MSDLPNDESEFTQVWKTLEIQETAELEAPTQTLRPPTQLPDGGTHRALGSLPVLTGGHQTNTDPQIAVKELLGRGGMGEVRLARQLPLGRDVAVKSIRKPISSDAVHAVDVLLRESWVTGRLEHPNIVPVHTLGRNEEDEPILVLKNIEGVSWADLLHDPSASPRHFDSDAPLDWHLEILSDVCDAVHFAHSRGIIHRDIKPENVMIGAFGETYLLDWGVAISLEADPEGRLPTADDVTSPAGTPAYMAPEMTTADGSRLCRQTDVFLLGATLHQILTGRPPHDGESLYEIMLEAYTTEPPNYGEDVHPELASVCRRAMQPDPADRFETAEAFRQALAHHRRHRESIQISEEASERLDDLRAAMEKNAPDARVYEAFGECRFGFEQALRVSADNDQARRGLQTVLEEMASFELERGSADAAALLINDLPEPAPELENRLEALEDELASRERELAELKQMRHEADVDVARHARSITAIALGLLWGLTLPFFEQMAGLVGLPADPTTYLLFALPVGLGVLGAGFVMRERILKNRANRQIAGGLFLLVLSGGGIMRLLGVTMSLTVPQTIALEMAIYGAGGSIFAVTLDPRIGWAAGPAFVGAFVAAIFPGSALWIFAAICLVSMGKLAWVWWPKD